MSYRVEDRWSAGSHGKHRGVCRGMPEHAPMLTSTVARRLDAKSCVESVSEVFFYLRARPDELVTFDIAACSRNL